MTDILKKLDEWEKEHAEYVRRQRLVEPTWEGQDSRTLLLITVLKLTLIKLYELKEFSHYADHAINEGIIKLFEEIEALMKEKE